MRRLTLFLLLWCLSLGSARAAYPDMIWSGLGSNATTTGASSYSTTAAYTPTSDALVLAMVVSTLASGPATLPTFSGNNLTWVQIATTNVNTLATPTERLTVFRAQGSGPTNGLGTADFGGVTQSGGIIRVVQIAGAMLGSNGAVAIRQVAANGADSGTTATVTLGALDTSGSNAVVAFFANGRTTWGGTPEAGYTNDYSNGYSSPSTGGGLQYSLATTDNTPAATVTSSAYGGVAVEVRRNYADTAWPVYGVAIETNGWVLRITNAAAPGMDGLSQANTNFAFYNGFLTNNMPSSTNGLTLTLTSMGFDDNGQGIQVSRTVYGTRLLRCPYPMQLTNDVRPDATTNCVLRIGLSDLVFLSDSNITMTLRSDALATTNGVNMIRVMATNLSVINESSQTHLDDATIANWGWPGWQRITNNTYRPRAVAFQRFAEQGRPVRAVRFVATSTNSIVVTNWVTRMDIDRAFGDAVPTAEYFADMDLSSLPEGPTRFDVTAYPWVGDTNFGVADTFYNVNSQPTALLCAQTNWIDRLRPVTWAVVHTNLGVDATGVACTNDFTAMGQWTNPFLTIGAAFNAIIKTNGRYYGTSYSNAGNAVVYCTQGRYAIYGTSISAGNEPQSFPMVTRHPTNSRTQVVIDRALNYTDNQQRFMHWYDLFLNVTSAIGMQVQKCNWIDNCDADSPLASFLSSANVGTNIFLTKCTITNLAKVGGATGSQAALVRGNRVFSLLTNTYSYGYTMMGNAYLSNDSGSLGCFFTARPGTYGVPMSAPIVYNNYASGLNANANCPMRIHSAEDGNNAAIIQNVWENWITNSAQALCDFGSSGATNLTNILIWNNTFVGNRALTAYSDTSSRPANQIGFSIVNTTFDAMYEKTDIFAAGANNIGNWSAVNGVGYSGLVHWRSIGAGLEAPPEFCGLNSFSNENAVNQTNYFRWTRNGACFGQVGTGTGQGDYRLLSWSPLFQFNCRWVLPFDIEGVPRGLSDPPGAYSSGNVKKGLF